MYLVSDPILQNAKYSKNSQQQNQKAKKDYTIRTQTQQAQLNIIISDLDSVKMIFISCYMYSVIGLDIGFLKSKEIQKQGFQFYGILGGVGYFFLIQTVTWIYYFVEKPLIDKNLRQKKPKKTQINQKRIRKKSSHSYIQKQRRKSQSHPIIQPQQQTDYNQVKNLYYNLKISFWKSFLWHFGFLIKMMLISFCVYQKTPQIIQIYFFIRLNIYALLFFIMLNHLRIICHPLVSHQELKQVYNEYGLWQLNNFHFVFYAGLIGSTIDFLAYGTQMNFYIWMSMMGLWIVYEFRKMMERYNGWKLVKRVFGPE